MYECWGTSMKFVKPQTLKPPFLSPKSDANPLMEKNGFFSVGLCVRRVTSTILYFRG